METDASRHRPLPTTGPARADDEPPVARTGSHLQLVVDAPAHGPELDDVSAAPTSSVEVEVEVETDPADVWSVDRIHGLLEAFHASPWGACLSPDQIGAIHAVMLTPDIHSFRGVAGLPFVADCLRHDVLERGFATRTSAMMRAVPAALRQWVRFVDRLGRGTLSEITLAKLEYIDRVEPAWQDAVTRHEQARRINRPRLIELLHELAADVGVTLSTDDELVVTDALEMAERLSLEPLVEEEPVDLTGLDPDTALRVLEISERSDHFFRLAGAGELCTAARRLLVQVARRDPLALRRPTARALAAGVCFAVIRGNIELVRRFDWLGTSSIAQELGVSRSTVPTRARALLAAAGIDQPAVDPTLPQAARGRMVTLGDPELLTGVRRTAIVERVRLIAERLGTCGV